MKRRHPAWLSCLAFLGIILAGCTEPEAEENKRPAVTIGVERVQAADFGESFSFSGSLTAERQVQLSPRVDGLVSHVHVDAGDKVEAGQWLLDLDPEVSQQALARTHAELERATAARREAERQLAITTRLGDSRVVARTQVEGREAELSLARAAERSAQASAHEQEELIARHRLPAPFSGVITERLTDSGAWVARGTSVLGLVATDRIRLDIRVPQERYAQITEGATVRVYSEALGGASLPARVAARVPSVDARGRTFLLRLIVSDPEGRLLPGMSARTEITMPPAADVFAINRNALLRQPDGGYSLFVVERVEGSTVARRKTVRLLYGRGDRVVISGNLHSGDQLIVRGNEALQDGQAVAVEGGTT